MEPGEARQLWHLLETVHAVTYFSPICRQVRLDLGMQGFWMGYFATRAAPMGPVAPGVVTATFFNFHPAMVERAIPDAWGYASPEAIIEARAEAAASALRGAVEPIDALAEEIVAALDLVVESAEHAGRPLSAANAAVDPFDDPVADLWQLATTLREHRGDGHVAVLTAEGVGGCEAHVLFAAAEGVPTEVLRENRGWPTEEWADAAAVLTAAGLLDGDQLTDRGRRLRDHIERRTDELAAAPYAALRPERRAALVDLLVPVAGSVLEQGIIPFPNPIGLPQVA